MVVSVRRYAQDRGVSEVAVRNWIKSGRILRLPGGGLDEAAADEAVLANRSGSQRSELVESVARRLGRSLEDLPYQAPVPIAPALPAAVPPSPSVAPMEVPPSEPLAEAEPGRAELERKLVGAKAEKAELDVARMRGELVPVAEVEQALTEIIEQTKNRLMLVPETVCDRLAASRDRIECRNIVEHEIRLALEGLSQKLAA